MGEGAQIVVATDLSEASVAALREAGRLAKDWGAALTVVHVYDPMPWVPPAMVPHDAQAVASISKEIEAAIERGLQERCAEVLAEVPGVRHVLRADASAARGVCKVAEELGAELVVVGTHGRTGLGRMVLGSVAEQVVRHAPCNVLVVRSGR